MRRDNKVSQKMLYHWPGPAWAWEFLRRNPDYRRAYRIGSDGFRNCIPLNLGGQIVRMRKRQPVAERWGLCLFENPDICANKAHIFWHPDYLSETLSVLLKPVKDGELSLSDILSVSDIPVRKSFLEMPGLPRQIRLFGEGFWMQLRTQDGLAFNENCRLEIQLRRLDTAGLRLKTAQNLLSILQTKSRVDLPVGTLPNARNLQRYLTAYDVRQAGGSYRDIAIALEGKTRVEEDWDSVSRYLKDRSKRAFLRGKSYVERDYIKLLKTG